MQYFTIEVMGCKHTIEAESEEAAKRYHLYSCRVKRTMLNKPYLSVNAAMQELLDNSWDSLMSVWLTREINLRVKGN